MIILTAADSLRKLKKKATKIGIIKETENYAKKKDRKQQKKKEPKHENYKRRATKVLKIKTKMNEIGEAIYPLKRRIRIGEEKRERSREIVSDFSSKKKMWGLKSFIYSHRERLRWTLFFNSVKKIGQESFSFTSMEYPLTRGFSFCRWIVTCRRDYDFSFPFCFFFHWFQFPFLFLLIFPFLCKTFW